MIRMKFLVSSMSMGSNYVKNFLKNADQGMSESASKKFKKNKNIYEK